MIINKKDLKILSIEKEHLSLYFDFKKLVKSHLLHPKYLFDYTKKETINILEKKGYVFLYKYQNIIVASCLIKPLNNKEVLIGPICIFEDILENKVEEFIIKDMNDLSKDLGYNISQVAAHKNDKQLINTLKMLSYDYLDKVKHKGVLFDLYQKDI